MPNSDRAGYHLSETWPRRLRDGLLSLVALVVAALTLGITIIFVLQAVMLTQADAFGWPYMLYLVLTVVGGVATVQLARGFVLLISNALSASLASPVRVLAAHPRESD